MMARHALVGAATVAALCVLATLVVAPTASAKPSSGEQRLQRALDRLVEIKGGPPGVSVVLRRGKREEFLTAGVADVEAERPFNARKRMKIASVSKAFSGAVALSLVDRGMLSLDDTIASRLPTLPVAWGAVTLRQVLQHTGGVPTFTKDPDYLQYFADHLHGQMTNQGLIDFVADQPLVFAPGTSYQYSNTDNIVIATMAEAATSKSYDELLSELVFDPLGLDHTRLLSGFKMPRPLIHGYEVLPVDDLSDCCSMDFVRASGALYSTPHELNRFIRGYVGGQLFGESARSQQFQFVAGGSSEPPGPGKNASGLALFRYETRCGTVFGHTGNFPGYTQFTAATRSGKRSLTVSANRQLAPDASGKRAPEVFETLRRDYVRAVCALLE